MLMNNKNGFSLISFLLYLMLFSIIALFIANIITSLLLPSLTATHTCRSIINLHIASDLFVRDIHHMKIKPYQWKKISQDELIWHIDDHDIGWCYNKKRIERREGIYNNGWKGKKTGVISTGIKHALFSVERLHSRIIGIEMSLVSEYAPQKTVTCYVALK